MKRSVIGLTIVLVGVLGALLAWWPGEPPEVAGADPGLPQETGTPAPDSLRMISPGTLEGKEPLPPLPGSLEGTEPPSGWRQLEDGRLIPTPALRELFEYFLSAIGELPLPDLVRLISAELSVLPDGPYQQALRILDNYLAYRMALGEWEQEAGGLQAADTPAELRDRLAQVRELRDSYLGPEASDAFFRQEEAYEDYALARMSLEREEGLSEAERKARLANIEAQLPPEVREARRQARRFVDYRQELQALREQGASEARIMAMRQERFGPEAAEKLAELDEARADWQRRWSAYREARAQLAEEDKMPGAPALQALRERFFSREELRRVRALDQMEQTPAQE